MRYGGDDADGWSASGDLVAWPPFAPEWTTADEVLFRLTRCHADPGATIASTAAPTTAVYLIESGALEYTGPGMGSETTTVWKAGTKGSYAAVEGIEQTLTVVGDEAASFLELLAIPESSATE